MLTHISFKIQLILHLLSYELYTFTGGEKYNYDSANLGGQPTISEYVRQYDWKKQLQMK